MVIDFFSVFGILGLLGIIVGTFMISVDKKVRRRYIYPFLFFGGIFLLIYSVFIGDMIFIILQSCYLAIVIYDMAKLYFYGQKNKKRKNAGRKRKK